MKLKYHFETIDMGNEIIAVPVGDGARDIHGVLKLNSTGEEIFGLLANNTSENSIIEVLHDKYEDEHSTLVTYVHNTIDTLRKAGLLEG